MKVALLALSLALAPAAFAQDNNEDTVKNVAHNIVIHCAAFYSGLAPENVDVTEAALTYLGADPSHHTCVNSGLEMVGAQGFPLSAPEYRDLTRQPLANYISFVYEKLSAQP